MKKIYTLAVAALLSLNAVAQSPFWTTTSYRGAFPVTDGLTGISSNNWLAGWTNWDPENAIYPVATTTISANITSNTTWTSGNTYLLVGNIAVTNNAVLTIQPGTVIRGDKTSKACLIISRGSQINAVGTVNNPIIFTSNEEPSGNGRAPADWGGVVILGNGLVNTACATCATNPKQNYIEGFATNFNEILYGGNNNAESSGTMSYCRIEFAGVALSSTPNSELNSLTMGGVGSGTQIDHIQTSFGGDDAFEWFGGAVDGKYLVAFRGLDDDFDTDFGHSGRVQFGLVVRDKDISDAAGDSNGFESDNFSPGIGRLPITKTVFSNITVLGPKRDGTVALPAGEKFERGIFTRRNTAISIYNSIFVGWEKGWHLNGATTFDNYNSTTSADSLGRVKNVLIASNLFPKFVNDAGGANATWYNNYAGNNSIDTTKTVAQISFVNAFPTLLEDNSDFRLTAASTASAGASFTDLCPLALVTTATVAPICANQTLNLQATATGTGTITYNWIGLGTIASANSATTTVTGASGNYTVNATNACGTTSAVVNVIVNTLPNVTIGTFSAVCLSNSNVTLTSGLPTGGSYSGTGVTGGVFSPAIAGVGTKTITYSYTDGNGCSNTAANNITVNALPNVTIGTFSAVCLSNSNITLTNGLPTGGSYSGNGVTSGVFSPATAGAGSQTITYSYTDGNGCSNTASNNITVNALPNVTIGTFSAVCSSNSNITLANGLPTGGSYSGTGVTSGVFSPATAGAGTYTITYSFTDGNGCSNTASNNITVNATPVLSLISSTICAGATGTVSASGANTYTWNTGATTNSITDNPAATTVYTVNGTSAAGCLGSSVSATITVGAAPSIVVNSASICAGSSATLTANGVSTYTWNTGANSASIVVTPTTNTVYNVNGDLLGCGVTASNSATVTINALPVISVNSGTICSGQSFTMNPSGATTYTYSSGSNVVSPVSGQSYTVTGTNVNGCVSASGAISTIAVNNLPTVTIGTFSPICLADASFTLTNGLPSGGSYSGNGVSTGVFSPATAGVGSQTITYSFTDGNGCSNTASNNILVNTCTSINQSILEANATTLFPNPASNKTMLVINANMTSKINVSIYDFTGKLVLNALTNENVTEGKNEFKINTENLSNGIYFLNINSDSSKETIKLIINN